MADDKLATARNLIGERIADLETRIARLTPRTISRRMDDIRSLAARHGLQALEGLADYGAHHAMMVGHRETTRACISHMNEALASHNGDHDRETILAALAVRFH